MLDGRVPHALRPCYLRRSVGAPSVPMQGMMHMHAHVPSVGPAVPPCEVYTSTRHICDDPRIWKQKRRVQALQARRRGLVAAIFPSSTRVLPSLRDPPFPPVIRTTPSSCGEIQERKCLESVCLCKAAFLEIGYMG